MDRPVVRLPLGEVRGTSTAECEQFLGMPYAEPPVGPLRFRAPRPIAPWGASLHATAFGPVCPQRFGAVDVLFGASDQLQDEAGMLTLNVWRPKSTRSGERLPVMVWIHGGALVGGAASWEPYRGDAFARDGVVFVGINYRLHALGFLDLSSHFDGHGDSVNLGLQDVALALNWVRDHIAEFGGDPEAVTVFGESAGAALVSALLGYEPARGTFQRAVMESGSALVLHDADSAHRIAGNALAHWGIAPGDREALEALPIERVLSALEADLMAGTDGIADFPWIPARDRHGLALSPLEAVEQGAADDVELIFGWTVDEYRLRWLGHEGAIPDEPAVPPRRLPPETLARARAIYCERMPEATGAEVDEKIANDQHFLAPAMAIARAHAARGGSSRVFEFRWRSPVQSGVLGACHALELPFVFDRAVAPGFHGTEGIPRELVDAMHGTWIDFAAGRPLQVGGAPWVPVAGDAVPLAAFDTRSTLTELDPEIDDLWAQVAPDRIGIA